MQGGALIARSQAMHGTVRRYAWRSSARQRIAQSIASRCCAKRSRALGKAQSLAGHGKALCRGAKHSTVLGTAPQASARHGIPQSAVKLNAGESKGQQAWQPRQSQYPNS